MRRRFLFASALATLTVSAPAAWADREITEEITTPIATSTAGDGGGADNIVISTSGRVVLSTPGTAVTLDSDNTIVQDGGIRVETDADGGVGVHIQGGNTGSFTSNSAIVVGDVTTPEDTDGDGLVDGPLAVGSGRVAILVDGTEVFTGDILLNSGNSITVRGNDSWGIQVLTGIDGDFTSNGRISVTGDRSTAIEITDDITGDVQIGGIINSSGDENRGVVISGDVGGSIFIDSIIRTTGYRFVTRPSEDQLDTVLGDPADVGFSGAAVLVNGSSAGGLLIAGPADDSPTQSAATISSVGPGAGLHIQATSTYGDLVLGEVVIAAVEDDPDTTEDETRAAIPLGFSLVNRGAITGRGELDGVTGTGIAIDGTGGFTATLTNGFLNTGSVTALGHSSVADNGIAQAVYLGDGAILPVFTNRGVLTAAMNGREAVAYGLNLGSGAFLPTFVNEGTISSSSNEGGRAVGIFDASGSLTFIENSGVIRTLRAAPTTGSDDSDTSTVAIDVSATTADVMVRQYRRDNSPDEFFPSMEGEIRFGSGDDELRVESGTVTGAMSFGDGADQLNISGGATVHGDLSDSDGDLVVNVSDSTLTLGSGTNTTLREATFGDGATLIFEIDDETGDVAQIVATGDVTFEAGSRVSAALTNLIGEGAEFAVLRADQLTIAESIETLQDTTAPYLYEADLTLDPVDSNVMLLTLRRRNADELGMNRNQSAAYGATLAAWEANDELGAAMAALLTESEFFNAYDQLLPEYASSAIQFAQAANDSATGALASRLEAVRRSPDETGGLWLQEFGYFADRAGTAFGPGYRGHGIGAAVGFDRPFGPFYAVGINLIGAASEISESDGFDDPMSAMFGQIGVYAGAEVAGLNVDLYGGVGIDSFEHNRRVLIGSFDTAPVAEWDGFHYTASMRVGRDIQYERMFVRPSFSIDYLSLSESEYTETGGGTGVDLYVGERDSSSFTGTAMLAFGARFESSDSWWAPQMRIGYRSEFDTTETETFARFAGLDDEFLLRSEAMPGSGFIFGLGIGGGSGYSTFSLDYDADVRDDFIRHTARLVMRLVF